MKIVKLIFVRHAQTVQNKNHIYQGQSIGGTISAQGKAEIKKVAQKLKTEKIDTIYASPLNRAKQTAIGIAKHHKEAKLIFEKDLMEGSGGIYEGQKVEKYLKDREQFKGNFFDFRPEGGESLKDSYERMKKQTREIILKSGGKTVVVVSHNAVLRLASFYLLEKPLIEKDYLNSYGNVKNTTVSTYAVEITGKNFIILDYSLNDSSHL